MSSRIQANVPRFWTETCNSESCMTSPQTLLEKKSFTTKTRGFAALTAKAALGPYEFERRVPREHDVAIDIQYCGICHSDIHQARDEWGGSIFPMVPGHEITGVVRAVGGKVTKYKVGDRVGVGTFVESVLGARDRTPQQPGCVRVLPRHLLVRRRLREVRRRRGSRSPPTGSRAC